MKWPLRKHAADASPSQPPPPGEMLHDSHQNLMLHNKYLPALLGLTLLHRRHLSHCAGQPADAAAQSGVQPTNLSPLMTHLPSPHPPSSYGTPQPSPGPTPSGYAGGTTSCILRGAPCLFIAATACSYVMFHVPSRCTIHDTRAPLFTVHGVAVVACCCSKHIYEYVAWTRYSSESNRTSLIQPFQRSPGSAARWSRARHATATEAVRP